MYISNTVRFLKRSGTEGPTTPRHSGFESGRQKSTCKFQIIHKACNFHLFDKPLFVSIENRSPCCEYRIGGSLAYKRQSSCGSSSNYHDRGMYALPNISPMDYSHRGPVFARFDGGGAELGACCDPERCELFGPPPLLFDPGTVLPPLEVCPVALIAQPMSFLGSRGVTGRHLYGSFNGSTNATRCGLGSS